MAKIIKNSLGNFLVIFVIFSLVMSWWFSGFPQIWQNPPIPPKIEEAKAATSKVFVTSCPYTIPNDWGSDSNNPATIEVIGGGRGGTGGRNNSVGGAGGAGGGYAKIANFTSTPASSISCQIGTGSSGTAGGNPPSTPSAGQDTWFSSTATVLSPGGGSATAAVGSTTAAGGSGGVSSGTSGKGGGGGGGAAGSTSDYIGKSGGYATTTSGTGGGGGGGSCGSSATGGSNTSSATGAAGGNGFAGGTGAGSGGGGTGGNGGTTSGCTNATVGATSTNFDSAHGSGGGGGGGGGYSGNAAMTCTGGNGGLYGGGGGGGGGTGNNGKAGGNGGNGANGLIVITYTVAVLPTVTTASTTNIGGTTATGNGSIDNTGGQPSTEEGFVYDTVSRAFPGNVAPAASGYVYSASSSGSFLTGPFTKGLTGLNPNTKYYIRAYSKNNIGYKYGTAEDSFTTLTSTISCSTNISSTDFGTWTDTSMKTSTPNASTTMSCSNTGSGCTLYVKDAGSTINPGLWKDPDLIESPDAAYNATATLAVGTEGYGIQAATNTAGSGAALGIPPRYLQTGNIVGGLLITNTTIASTTADTSNREVIVTHKAAVAATTPSGSYSDTITYECTIN